MEVNALNCQIKNSEHIFYNKIKTVFYNSETNNYLKVTDNNRSFGVWVGRKFIPLSKIDNKIVVIDNEMSDDLKFFLNQF